MSKDTQQAFPGERKVYRAGYDTGEYEPVPGMFLRDYFAAKAMEQGMAVLVASGNNLNVYQLGTLAKTAYLAADAMLEERMK